MSKLYINGAGGTFEVPDDLVGEGIYNAPVGWSRGMEVYLSEGVLVLKTEEEILAERLLETPDDVKVLSNKRVFAINSLIASANNKGLGSHMETIRDTFANEIVQFTTLGTKAFEYAVTSAVSDTTNVAYDSLNFVIDAAGRKIYDSIIEAII